MDCIPQEAMDGDADMFQDGLAEICSCNICTSTIRGGRISHEAMKGSVSMFKDERYLTRSHKGGVRMYFNLFLREHYASYTSKRKRTV